MTNSKLTSPFRRAKSWEIKIAKFLPGAKLYGRGVSTPDFVWAPHGEGAVLQFEIKNTSSIKTAEEVKELRHALNFAGVLSGHSCSLEIYENLKFISSTGKDSPYDIKYKQSYYVVSLDCLKFWYQNIGFLNSDEHIEGKRPLVPFEYYPPLGSNLKELLHKGLNQLQSYIDGHKGTKGGGVIIAVTGVRTRDQLCIIPKYFVEKLWELN